MENAIEQIKVLTLNPGDVLVVTLKEKLPVAATEAFARQISDKMKELFPNNTCLLMGHGTEIEIISQKLTANGE